MSLHQLQSLPEEVTRSMDRKRHRKLFKALLILTGTCVLVFGWAAISIYAYGAQTTNASAPAGIVLGAGVWGDAPSPVFRERINHAIELYRQHRVRTLIFTGGRSKNSVVAEAEAAKRYAIKNGVAEADILTENHSHTTLENLRYARQVAQQHRLTRFLLISDPLHMKRAMALATGLDMDVYSSPTPTTRYKTMRSEWGFLWHETWFYLDYKLERLIGRG